MRRALSHERRLRVNRILLPARQVDWIPVFLISIAVGAVDARIGDLEKRLGGQVR
jgi:hypothetical protein